MTFSHYALGWEYAGPTRLKLLMLALADHADAHGRCYPSTTRLAARTGLHRATVIRGLSELESAGVIRREPRRGRSTVYHLLPVAHGDQSQDATSSDTQPDQLHTATTPVAPRDPTSRTTRPEPITEPSIKSPTEPRGGADEDWRDFLKAYPKQAATGDAQRFAALSPTQRRQAVSAALQYVAADATEERYRKSVSTFLSDPIQLEVLAERWDKKLADKARREAAALARYSSGTGNSTGFSPEQWDKTGESARKAKAALAELTASHTIPK